MGEVDQGGEEEYKPSTAAKCTNLFEYSDFLHEFAGLLLYSSLHYFSTTYYCGWTLIQIHDNLEYIYSAITKKESCFFGKALRSRISFRGSRSNYRAGE